MFVGEDGRDAADGQGLTGACGGGRRGSLIVFVAVSIATGQDCNGVVENLDCNWEDQRSVLFMTQHARTTLAVQHCERGTDLVERLGDQSLHAWQVSPRKE